MLSLHDEYVCVYFTCSMFLENKCLFNHKNYSTFNNFTGVKSTCTYVHPEKSICICTHEFKKYLHLTTLHCT